MYSVWSFTFDIGSLRLSQEIAPWSTPFFCQWNFLLSIKEKKKRKHFSCSHCNVKEEWCLQMGLVNNILLQIPLPWYCSMFGCMNMHVSCWKIRLDHIFLEQIKCTCISPLCRIFNFCINARVKQIYIFIRFMDFCHLFNLNYQSSFCLVYKSFLWSL